MAYRTSVVSVLTLAILAVPPAYAGGSAPKPITIDVAADIQKRCGLAATGATTTAPSLRIDQAQTVHFDFQVDCNTPFVIGAHSANGALRHLGEERGAIAGDGFALEKPYQVALSVNTEKGALSPAQCGSRTLRSAGSCDFFGAMPGEGVTSGKRIAIQEEGRLTVTWPAGDGNGPRLAAGAYQDMITVVIGPRT